MHTRLIPPFPPRSWTVRHLSAASTLPVKFFFIALSFRNPLNPSKGHHKFSANFPEDPSFFFVISSSKGSINLLTPILRTVHERRETLATGFLCCVDSAPHTPAESDIFFCRSARTQRSTLSCTPGALTTIIARSVSLHTGHQGKSLLSSISASALSKNGRAFIQSGRCWEGCGWREIPSAENLSEDIIAHIQWKRDFSHRSRFGAFATSSS